MVTLVASAYSWMECLGVVRPCAALVAMICAIQSAMKRQFPHMPIMMPGALGCLCAGPAPLVLLPGCGNLKKLLGLAGTSPGGGNGSKSAAVPVAAAGRGASDSSSAASGSQVVVLVPDDASKAQASSGHQGSLHLAAQQHAFCCIPALRGSN